MKNKDFKHRLPAIALLLFPAAMLGLLAVGKGLYSVLGQFSQLADGNSLAFFSGICGIVTILLLVLSFLLSVLSFLPKDLPSLRNLTFFSLILYLLSSLSTLFYFSFGYAEGLLSALDSVSLFFSLAFAVAAFLLFFLLVNRDYRQLVAEAAAEEDRNIAAELEREENEDARERIRERILDSWREGRITDETKTELLKELDGKDETLK